MFSLTFFGATVKAPTLKVERAAADKADSAGLFDQAKEKQKDIFK